MRPTFLLVAILSLSVANANWLSRDKPEYTSWSSSDLQSWLEAHNVPVPSGTPSIPDLQALVKSHWDSASNWSADQYSKAQEVLGNLKDDAFDAWDEGRLRTWLVEMGVVEPKGTREQLALMAKHRYNAMARAASSASARASTAIYGDKLHQASKSATSIAALASETAARKLDDTKDYVYSTWDDAKLRAYLIEHDVLSPTEEPSSRAWLLAKMKDAYEAVANPIWEAWSDSYIHSWLVDHNIIKSAPQKKRDEYLSLMSKYYYDTKDTAWSSWDDSDIKQWLVDHNVVKSESQIQRDKLRKLIADNYANAHDTVWSAWRDSDMESWLVEHGYLKSDAQKTREELEKLMHDKYRDFNSRTAPYLVWPDARLRAYLREHGISEEGLPTERPGLLQEVRIRWVQTEHGASAVLAKIREAVNGGVNVAEEKLAEILEALTGGTEYVRSEGGAKYEAGKKAAAEKYKEAVDHVEL